MTLQRSPFISRSNRKVEAISALLLCALAGVASAQTVVSAEKILAVGDIPSWSNAAPVTAVDTAFTNIDGQVGFVGTVTPAAGTARVFAFREGFTPFFADSALPSTTLTGREGTMGIGSNGQFVYSPSINGNDGIWSSNGYIVSDGDPVPDLSGKFFSFASRPTLFGESSFAFIAGFSNTVGGASADRALYRGDLSSSGLTRVYKTGDVLNGETLRFATPTMSFLYDFSDNGEHLIHIMGVGGGSSAANNFVNRDGLWIAKPSQALPGSPFAKVAWNTFSGVSINNAGEWVIFGVSSNFDVGAATNFVAFNGVDALHRTATVDGITLTTGVVRAASVNNFSQVAHLWSYGSGSVTPKVLFVGPGNDLASSRAIVKIGDLADLNADGVGDFRVYDLPEIVSITAALDLSDDGKVTTRVVLEPLGGGTRFDAILRFCYQDCSVGACPECAADYDQSGGVDGADIESFFIDWSASVTCADIDLSGGVDGSDIESFFTIWSAGGC